MVVVAAHFFPQFGSFNKAATITPRGETPLKFSQSKLLFNNEPVTSHLNPGLTITARLVVTNQ